MLKSRRIKTINNIERVQQNITLLKTQLQEVKDLKETNKIQILINRLMAQKAIHQTKEKTRMIQQRKARTRTLIQLGSLLNLSGIPQLFNITEGEDLQLSKDAMDKAATLLGFLSTFQSLTTKKNQQDYKEIGMTKMRKKRETGKKYPLNSQID